MSYLGIPPFGRTSRTVTEVAAISGQTTFYPTGGYTVGYIDVVLNGIQLNSTDFTATDGLAVVLLSPAAVNDELHFTSYTVNFVEVDPSGLAVVALSGSYSDLLNKPTTISGYGITDAQPLDADLTAIAAISGTTGLLKKTAANTWTLDTSAYLTGINSGQVTTALGFTPYNSTNPSGYINGNQTITFTGDASGSGTTGVALTLANSGVTAGTYGSTTNIPQIVVDAKGRITGVTNVAVSIPSGSITFTGDVTGTGTTGSSTALTLANSGVVSGTYTKTTVDAKGRVTSGTTLSASDIPSLDANKITSGTIDAARLPSYVDDVLEYTNLAGFPASGETGKIYVALDTNKTYRWSGSAYVYITSGAVDSVAGRTGVVTLTSADVGLGSVENKSSATIRSEISSANVTGALGFTPYNSTNPSGYISGITSGQVTTALGFTPYNATNPSGYITGITSANVTTALGYTPYNSTNPSGYITSSALSPYLTSSTASSTYLPLTGGTLTGAVNASGTSGSVGGYFGTIKVGYGSAYGTIERTDSDLYLQYNNAYNVYTGYGGGFLYAYNSARSPIFYDSDNTSFYINPTGYSSLSTLKLSGGDSSTATQQIEASVYPMLDFISTSTDANNRNWRIAGVYNSYGLLQILSSTTPNGAPTTARLAISGSSGYVGIGAAATGPSNHFQIGSMGSTGYSGNHFAIGNGTQVFAQYLNGATSMEFYTNSGYFYFDKYVQAANSMRAPVFYDSGDTSYYIDPASSSRANEIVMTTAQFNPSGVFLRQATTAGNRNLLVQGTASGDVGIHGLGNNGGFGFQIYGDGGSNYGFLNSLWGAWDLRKANGGALYLNNQSSYYYGTDTTYMYRVYGTGDIRSPIYYDNDDTGYYLNAAGTSSLDRIAVVRSGQNVYTDANYGYGLVGAYSSTRYQGIFAMGDSYKLPADGTTTGSLYGIAWSHPNAGGVAANLSSHGALFLENGTFMAAISTSIRAASDVRAPIFYDLNDTSYYIDPNSTGNTALRMRGGALFGPNTTWGAYLSIGTNGNASTSYASVAATNGNLHMDAAAGCAMYLNYYAGTEVRAYGSLMTPIVYDLDDTAYYVNPNGTSNLNKLSAQTMSYNDMNSLSANSPYVGRYGGSANYRNGTMGYGTYDFNTIFSNWGSGFIDSWSSPGNAPGGSSHYVGLQGLHYSHQDGSQGYGFQMLTAGEANNRFFWRSAWPTLRSWVEMIHTGNINSQADLRAPVFYDSDNTGYYVDPAGTSYILALSVGGYNSAGSALNINWPSSGYINFWGGTGQTLNINNASGLQVNLVVSGNVTAYSDERRKHDWQDVSENYVQRLAAVRSGTYMRSDGGSDERQAGVGAQSFSTLLPEVVSADENGYLSLAYGNAALVSAVELAKHVVKQDQKIAELTQLVQKLLDKE